MCVCLGGHIRGPGHAMCIAMLSPRLARCTGHEGGHAISPTGPLGFLLYLHPPAYGSAYIGQTPPPWMASSLAQQGRVGGAVAQAASKSSRVLAHHCAMADMRTPGQPGTPMPYAGIASCGTRAKPGHMPPHVRALCWLRTEALVYQTVRAMPPPVLGALWLTSATLPCSLKGRHRRASRYGSPTGLRQGLLPFSTRTPHVL